MRWKEGETVVSLRRKTLLVSKCFDSPWPLSKAFCSLARIRSRYPDRILALTQALAARLTVADLDRKRDRDRLRWWHGFCPEQIEEKVYFIDSEDGLQQTLRLTKQALVLDGKEGEKWWLLDDVLFHGPPVLGISLADRIDMKERIRRVSSAHFEPSDFFPCVDHTKIAAKSWEWDHQYNGCRAVDIKAGVVTIGYQFAQDFGWSIYPLERVLCDAPDIYWDATDEITAELRNYILPAIVPSDFG